MIEMDYSRIHHVLDSIDDSFYLECYRCISALESFRRSIVDHTISRARNKAEVEYWLYCSKSPDQPLDVDRNNTQQ